MTQAWEEIKRAFVDDHQVLTRGLQALLETIENRDFAATAYLADQLDTQAGPHIEFEESYLYPAVRASRGDEYVAQLYQEHRDVLATIVELQTLNGDATPSEQQIDHWQSRLKGGLDHTAACGTLLSQLQASSPRQQREYLDALHRLQRQARRWSDLPLTPEHSESVGPGE